MLMRRKKTEKERHETQGERSPFLEIVRAAIPVRNYKYTTEQEYWGVNAPLQRPAVQSPLGATLRLNLRAVPEQTASTDTDTPEREPPDDD